ncbi:DUF1326 domain-containing protein [Arthrobacter sp. 9MFCol3.1]|uniref:DUF1326 domain-containing protein n=1 Tax=Arthrobacter sp. 9MFCol3.1 TaxID=1150398 RepID=UPI000A47B1D5|nr:DUF1326 domain-containing protein [Arthrobacter sp. 9MFCol3.1]
MPWHLEGTYFENCNCDMVCPCTASGQTAPADNDRCNVALAFHVETGDVNGVDVGGLTVCVVADTPALMSVGGWKVGLLMDAAASAEQVEALGAVFVDMVVEDFMNPFDSTGRGVKISGVGFPADTRAADTSSTARVDVFGMTWDNTGKNSFSAPSPGPPKCRAGAA